MQDENLIISIKEFRKLVGKKADQLNDAQVKKVIMDLDFIAKIYINSRKENKND